MKASSNLKLEKFFYFWVYLSLSVSLFSFSIISCSKKKEGERYRLQSPVHVVIDRCGVPHIFAESDSDAFFILGYIQAHFRLFQMDISRRDATGRLAEIFPWMFNHDVSQRMLGFRFMAEKTFESFKDVGILKKVQAFVDGINRYIDDAKEGKEFGGIRAQIPIQYRILKIQPEYFNVVDVIAVGKKRSFELSGGGGFVDIAAKLMQLTLGSDFEKKFSLGPVEKVKIVDDIPTVRVTPFSFSTGNDSKGINLSEADLRKIVEALAEKLKSIGSIFSFPLASNNFVISSKITSVGYPILEDDPHLSVIAPSEFFPFHINSPEYSVKGFTFPGIPVALVGGGDNVCWGVTVSFVDAVDILLTPIEQEGNDFFVRWGKNKVRAEPFEEEIFYKEGENLVSRKIKMLYVPNIGIVVDPGNLEGFGSIIPYLFNLIDVPGGGYRQQGPLEEQITKILKYILALGIVKEEEKNKVPQLGIMIAWPGYKPTSEISAFYGLARSKDIFEAMTQIKFFQVGTQNFVVADTKGNIGYFPHAEIPVRPKGTKPYLPDLSERLFWIGFLHPDFIPRAINPESGYVATSNNDIIGTAFDNNPLNERFYIGAFFDAGFRQKNIVSLIEKSKGYIDKVTAAYILNSAESELAKSFLNILFNFVSETDIELISESKEKKEFIKFMMDKLKSWNYQSDINSSEPLFYELIMKMSFSTLIWENFIKVFIPRRLKDLIYESLRGTELEGLSEVIYSVGNLPLSLALFQILSEPTVMIRFAFPVLSGQKGELCPINNIKVSSFDERKILLGEDLCPKNEFLESISKTADFLLENSKVCKRDENVQCVEFICKGGDAKNCVLGDFLGKRFRYFFDIPEKELFEPKYYGSKYFRKSGGSELAYAAGFNPIKFPEIQTQEDFISASLQFLSPSEEKEFLSFEMSQSGQTLKYLCEAKPTGAEIWFAIPGGVADDPASPYFANMITAWACQREWLMGVTEGYCAIPKEIAPSTKNKEELFKISFSKLETIFSDLISGNYHTSPVCNQREIYFVFTPQ